VKEGDLLKDFALFYFTLQHKYIVPASTVQQIILDIQKLLEKVMHLKTSSLKCVLAKHGVAPDVMELAVEELKLKDAKSWAYLFDEKCLFAHYELVTEKDTAKSCFMGALATNLNSTYK